MLAVIEMGWNQFTVKVGDVFDVKRQDEEAWKTITLEALLVADEEWTNVKVGTPTVVWSKVELKVIDDELRGDKVRVFKMKSKKRYSRTVWFRSSLTKVEVVSIA